jgi:hypothetical protein
MAVLYGGGGFGFKGPPSPSLLILGPLGSQETELELMLGVAVPLWDFHPSSPWSRLLQTAMELSKRWELVIIIWGLGMPMATNGPAATAGAAHCL